LLEVLQFHIAKKKINFNDPGFYNFGKFDFINNSFWKLTLDNDKLPLTIKSDNFDISEFHRDKIRILFEKYSLLGCKSKKSLIFTRVLTKECFDNYSYHIDVKSCK
jgi:hypothetical protein